MSDFLTDLTGVISSTSNAGVNVKHSTNTKAGQELVMDDFLKLLISSFQNQSIDDVASTSDMMNQMVQMSVINAVTNLNKLLTESTGLSYAASLVGKEVTIGQSVGKDMYTVTGTVTGTGTLNGEQVVFLGDESYMLSEILAIGKLPSTAKVSGSTSAARAAAQSTAQDAAVNTRRESTYPTVTPEDSGDGYDYAAPSALERDFFIAPDDMDDEELSGGEALASSGADIAPEVFDLEGESGGGEVVYYPVEPASQAQPAGSDQGNAAGDHVEDGFETTI